MATRIPTALLCAAIALGVAGCKIVKKAPEGEAAIAADESGDDARNAMRIDETFEARLLPHVRDTAVPIAELRTLTAADLDAAGTTAGNRGAGQGAAWNFPVSGEGTVIEANLESRARAADLDTDGDGIADLTLQLGPVIRGTALRDVAPFFRFDDFRDQIEFAKLGRGINDRLSTVISVPDGDLVGRRLRFIGVVPLRKAEDAWLVTPVLIEALP